MTASPKPCGCPCTCNNAGPLAVLELRRRAFWYAEQLTDGDEIDETTDGAHVAPFAAYLPEAIVARGMRMTVRLVGSGLVTTVHDSHKEQKEATT